MNSKISKYKNYSIQDYVLDVDFIAWTKQMSEENEEIWATVSSLYPTQALNIQEAKEFLLNATIVDKDMTTGQQQRIWQAIEEQLKLVNRKPVYRLNWLKIAAIILLTAGIGLIAHYVSTNEREIKTTYAEIRHIELPDHSKITLNANSSIRYSNNWSSKQPREVWLTGEAYFEVNHLHKGTAAIESGERFIVHADGVDIEVLGTAFNVNNRHEVAKITLTSGKIELKFKDQNIPNVVMQPGEFVSYRDGETRIEKKTENPRQASSWKEHQWVFNKTSLKEVLQLLKDNFGLDAKVEDTTLFQQTISGSISSDNSQILLNGLSTLMDIKIEQKEKTLYLKK